MLIRDIIKIEVNMNEVTFSEFASDKISFNHRIVPSPTEDLFPPHTHETYEFILYIKGDISYVFEGKECKLKKYDLVVTRPSVIHYIRPDSQDEYERFDLIFNENILSKSLREKLEKFEDVINLSSENEVLGLFEKLDWYLKKFSGEDLENILTNVISEIMYNVAYIKVEKDKINYLSLNESVYKAINYINENLTTIKDLQEICDYLYITKSHFHHLFLKNMHVSPKRYITEKRLMLARELLRRGKKATEVYVECGFYDYTSFYRAYKKTFGYTPIEESHLKPLSITEKPII